MRLLLLGPDRPVLASFLKELGNDVITFSGKLTDDHSLLEGVDWAISYGYGHIIKPNVISRLQGRIINLHISLLPWNRGADPNLWSFLEDTPKGVTIHFIDSGIDTGQILAQEEVEMECDDTLSTSYQRLTNKIELLFMEIWTDICTGKCKCVPQVGDGTSHRRKDKKKYMHLLTEKWDTKTSDLIGKALVPVGSSE
ncbi:MAG: formyl transferase [Candidatus Zixiibacteriota bacterium]|nr:MAG: formyl transferase [candidate division Zixibacteria bacterium]